MSLRLTDSQKMSWNAASLLAAFLVVMAILFGGASQRHDIQLALVELSAVPLLCLALYQVVLSGAWRDNRALLGLTAAVIAVPVVQLIPLPPDVWTALPGREQSRLALEILGQAPTWRPISLTPDATRAALWALIPPVAMLLAMMVLDSKSRMAIGALFVAGAVVSICLSWAQVAVGGEGLYLYPHVQPGWVVGLSANRNHLSTLAVMALPIAAAIASARFWARSPYENGGRWLFGIYAAIAVIGIGLTRSRTGIVLAGPVLIASLVLIWHASRESVSGWKTLGLTVVAASGFAAIAAFGLAPIMERFDPLQAGTDGRFEAWPIVLQAGGLYQPVGSGLGSFDPVFRAAEPLSHLSPVFFNRAHNDCLEIWLETGLFGVGLLTLALIWFGRAWWSSFVSSSLEILDRGLARAAGLAILVVIFHSLVDYPIRTETIAVFAAYCFGALMPCMRTTSPTR